MTYRSPLPLPRRADHTLFPAIVAGILALALVLQLMLPRQFDLSDVGVLRPFALAPVTPTMLPIDPVIAAHSIFASPYAAPGAAVVQAAPLEGAVAAGMATRRGLTTAFVQSPAGVVTGLHVGDAYRGWRLQRAGPSGLIFRRDGKQVTLSFTNALSTGAGTLPTPTGSR